MDARLKGKTTLAIWSGKSPKEFPPQLVRIAQRKLVIVLDATSLNVLRVPPGNRLEELKSDRAGQHSIRINDQWRICFVWDGVQTTQIEVVDYH